MSAPCYPKREDPLKKDLIKLADAFEKDAKVRAFGYGDPSTGEWLWNKYVGQNARMIEVKEDMGRAVYRISKSPIENSMNGNREHIKRKSFSNKLWEETNCNN